MLSAQVYVKPMSNSKDITLEAPLASNRWSNTRFLVCFISVSLFLSRRAYHSLPTVCFIDFQAWELAEGCYSMLLKASQIWMPPCTSATHNTTASSMNLISYSSFLFSISSFLAFCLSFFFLLDLLILSKFH